MFEGDLDREVLGLKTWPTRQRLVLEKTGNSARVNGGVLQGITEGSILAVHAQQDTEFKTALGYLRVLTVTASASTVESCDYQTTKPTPLEVPVPVNDHGRAQDRLAVTRSLRCAGETSAAKTRSTMPSVSSTSAAVWTADT